MFNRLPDLLGRNFIIGYFFPALFFLISTYLIDSNYFFLPSFFNITFLTSLTIFEALTFLGLLSILIGIILLSINREIIRLLEGYGKLNPFRLLGKIEICRLKNLEKKIKKTSGNITKYELKQADLKTEYLKVKRRINKFKKTHQVFTINSLFNLIKEKRFFEFISLKIKYHYKDFIFNEINKKVETLNEALLYLNYKRIQEFPLEKKWLLPSSFGNIIRSFETYSSKIYSVDAIAVWSRLLAVIPESYSQFIDQSKTQVDLWVNFWFVNIIIIIIYLVNFICFSKYPFIYYNQEQRFIFPFLCLFFAYFSFQQAKKAALEWGELVKAAFDLFLDDLDNKLKVNLANNKIIDKKHFRENYSHLFLYAEFKETNFESETFSSELEESSEE